MEKSGSNRVSIYLEPHWSKVSISWLADAIYRTLPLEITKVTFGPALTPLRSLLGDFRDSIVEGLSYAPPSDEEAVEKIREALMNDLERRRLNYMSIASRLEQGAPSVDHQRILEKMRSLADSISSFPISTNNMREYARVEVRRRIDVMLDRDIARGLLRVTSIDHKRSVTLDDLVAWAVPRRIDVEQDALPGCPPLIHASYQKWREQFPVVNTQPRSPSASVSPAPVVAASAADGAETAQAPPKEVANSAPQGLATPDIAQCFADLLGWSSELWRKNLNAAKWAATAQIERGAQGGASALWNPMTLAQLIHGRQKNGRDREKVLKAMNGRFNSMPALAPWRAGFNEYFATHFGAD